MIAKQGQAEKVLELLLVNPRRIEEGETGNLAFAVHRSIENPNEFWLYETWESEEAVGRHESGDGFKSSVPPVVAVSSPELAVVRFHGRRAETWEQRDVQPSERFRYLYDEDELADWVPRIREVAKAAKQTHVLMNNCFGNYGTTNARELADLLRAQLG